MSLGLVGRKCGMTRIFRENGDSIPVTVIEALPNRVTTVKTAERDGYRAVQVTVGAAPKARPDDQARSRPFRHRRRSMRGAVCMSSASTKAKALSSLAGAELKVDLFKEGQYVDVSGLTKGKGYAGVIKRHHFSHQYMSHGNSLSHRAPGSIGQRQTPGRVFPGQANGRAASACRQGHQDQSRGDQGRRRAQLAARQGRGTGQRERPSRRSCGSKSHQSRHSP